MEPKEQKHTNELESERQQFQFLHLCLENNDCVTLVFMVLFSNKRLFFWSEEFVPRGAARGTIPNYQNNNL